MIDKSKKDKRAGVIGSTIFHAVILILLLVVGLSRLSLFVTTRQVSEILRHP
jgi:hypothetical protein